MQFGSHRLCHFSLCLFYGSFLIFHDQHSAPILKLHLAEIIRKLGLSEPRLHFCPRKNMNLVKLEFIMKQLANVLSVKSHVIFRGHSGI